MSDIMKTFLALLKISSYDFFCDMQHCAEDFDCTDCPFNNMVNYQKFIKEIEELEEED